MGFENIRVTIEKNGKIRLQIQGATEVEVRNFKIFLEEMLGPIVEEVHLERPPWEQELTVGENRSKELKVERGG